MAKYQVAFDDVPVRSAQSLADEDIVTRFPKDREFEGERAPGISMFVKVIEPSPPGPNAFILLTRVREIVTQITPEPIDESDHDAEHDRFCRLVTRAAREHGPERDYLMAVAYGGTNNLAEFGTAASKEVGPFRITAEEWKQAITDGVAKNMGFSEGDRYLWYRQPVVAALRAAECGSQLRADLNHNPDFTELYFAQRFGVGAADLLKGDRTLLCSNVIPGNPPVGSYAATLKTSNKTIAKALEELQATLVSGLTEALKVIDRQPPEIRFFRPSQSDPPWLVVAREEMDRIVVEIPGNENNDRIALYHRTAGVADTRDEVPWCASFVTYCMKASGAQDVANSVPQNNPALTSSWEPWGRDVADGATPVGSVIVLQPGGPETGHVGFFIEQTGGLIDLLGGNQGQPNKVGRVKFPVGQVRHRRWLDVAPGIASAQLSQIFPNCVHPGLWAQEISAAWHRFGIATKSARAGFLGIIGNETEGLVSVRRENMKYSAKRAAEVWPQRAGNNTGFPTQTCIEKVEAGEEPFTNWIYAGVNGNGNEGSGDGWKYRGGGMIQLTGRANYQACAKALAQPDLMENPDLLATNPSVSARAAAWFMVEYAKILSLLDRDDQASFVTAAAKVGLPPDASATQRRLDFRRLALEALQ